MEFDHFITVGVIFSIFVNGGGTLVEAIYFDLRPNFPEISSSLSFFFEQEGASKFSNIWLVLKNENNVIIVSSLARKNVRDCRNGRMRSNVDET